MVPVTPLLVRAADRHAPQFWVVCAAAALVALLIWVRPAPPTLYGVDAARYARVARDLTHVGHSQWVAVHDASGEVLSEAAVRQPPGFVFFEAQVFRAAGATTHVAVVLARVMATLAVALAAAVAWQLGGTGGALGTLLGFCAQSGFLFESQNPMLSMPLCGALCLGLLGALRLAQQPIFGAVLLALGAWAAFWLQGVAVIALLPLTAWAVWHTRASAKSIAGAAVLTILCVVGTAAQFEAARQQAGLASFFHFYWQGLKDGGAPQGLGFYVAALWRWYAVGLLLLAMATLSFVPERHGSERSHRLVMLSAVWLLGSVVVWVLTPGRGQFNVHTVAPALAWAGGALLLGSARFNPRRGWRRAGFAVAALALLYVTVVKIVPERLRTPHPVLEAMQAAQAPAFAAGEPRRIALCTDIDGPQWHLSAFLWDAAPVPCDAPAAYRFDGQHLIRNTL